MKITLQCLLFIQKPTVLDNGEYLHMVFDHSCTIINRILWTSYMKTMFSGHAVRLWGVAGVQYMYRSSFYLFLPMPIKTPLMFSLILTFICRIFTYRPSFTFNRLYFRSPLCNVSPFTKPELIRVNSVL